MIEVFEGKLGGGKTYSAVVRILDTLRKGGVVATNIELNREHCCQWIASKFGVILDWDRQVYVLDEASIFEFHKHVPCGATTPSLVVIDEAHLWFNAREWKSASKDVLTFLTQSRKIRVDIIFITQDAKNLDGQFRRMVQFIWRFRDLDRWKVPILGIPFTLLMKVITLGIKGSQVLASQFDLDGRTLLERWFVDKDKNIFKAYSTNALLRPIPNLSRLVVENVVLEKVQKKSIKLSVFSVGIVLLFWAFIGKLALILFV